MASLKPPLHEVSSRNSRAAWNSFLDCNEFPAHIMRSEGFSGSGRGRIVRFSTTRWRKRTGTCFAGAPDSQVRSAELPAQGDGRLAFLTRSGDRALRRKRPAPHRAVRPVPVQRPRRAGERAQHSGDHLGKSATAAFSFAISRAARRGAFSSPTTARAAPAHTLRDFLRDARRHPGPDRLFPIPVGPDAPRAQVHPVTLSAPSTTTPTAAASARAPTGTTGSRRTI